MATALAADHGLPITFNMYSPTTSYLDKLATAAPNDKEFFRTSSPDHNLIFDAADLRAVRMKVEAVMEEWPETVVYSRAYNRWMTEPGRVTRSTRRGWHRIAGRGSAPAISVTSGRTCSRPT